MKITNLDDDANIIETEYQNGTIVIPEDNVPEELERVYADIQEKEGPSWYLLIPVTAGGTASAILITALITRTKKQKKEATIDEQ